MKPILLFAQVAGEKLPDGLRKKFQVLRLRLGGEPNRGDYYTAADLLRDQLQGGWSPAAFDLLNVMTALRAADRFFASEGRFRYNRSLAVAVGVTNVKAWRRFSSELVATVSELSQDQIHFYPLAIPKTVPLSTPDSVEAGDLQADSVCLFSGGADSFAGAEFLLHKKRRPTLVSYSTGAVSGLQKDLCGRLGERYPSLTRDHLVQVRSYPHTKQIRQRAGRKKLYWRNRDQLQRLRSMYFYSLAAIVARALNADDVFMCENGLVAAAISFSPRDDNAMTTRPGEPHYLRQIQQFLRLALDYPQLCIRNPFQYQTKGQVIADANSRNWRTELHLTVSCWRSGNQGLHNCGRCIPCMFRQLAFSEAGLSKTPDARRYEFPLPGGRRWKSWASPELDRLEDLRAYCLQVQSGGVPWLMANELAVADAIDVTGGSVRESTPEDKSSLDADAPMKVAKVIRNFANATLERLR